MTQKYTKSCFSVKKLILTSERRVEHPFAGRNTQQPLLPMQNHFKPKIMPFPAIISLLVFSVAIAAGRKLAHRLFNNESESRLDYENIPSVVFTHPPIGNYYI